MQEEFTEIMEQAEIIKNYIYKYDSVFVLSIGILKIKKIFKEISKYPDNKILLLIKNQEVGSISKGNIDIQMISDKEYGTIEELYYMYEFSDRIHLLDADIRYGGLDNYILSGLMTEEEAVAAMVL